MEKQVSLIEESLLSDDFVKQLTAIGEVDILVALTTHNSRETIQRALSTAYAGLVQSFPRQRAAILNLDGGSADGTPDLFQRVTDEELRNLVTANPLRTVPRISASYRGAPGDRDALHLMCAAADLLRAKACVRTSAGLVHTQRIDSLVRQVLKAEFDYVIPVYARDRFDGMLAKNILSPMIRGTYGYRISEPAVPEFACSGRLAGYYLEQDIWRQRIDGDALGVWMTTSAMTNGYKACQVHVGPRAQLGKAHGKDLPGLIREVVGSLFQCLELHEAYWISRTESEMLSPIGNPFGEPLAPTRINRKRMLEMFLKGVQDLAEILDAILSPETAADIRRIAALPNTEFCFPDPVWVRTIYEFAASYHRSVINRDHLLLALAPLLRGRIVSFVHENDNAQEEQVDQRLEALGQEFEQSKPYFVHRWKNEG
jgi:hypothetical protein